LRRYLVAEGSRLGTAARQDIGGIGVIDTRGLSDYGRASA
jgi:hypothetical protein